MNDANHQFHLNFSYDSVTLYDGDSIAAPELVKYCGEVCIAEIVLSLHHNDEQENKHDFSIRIRK